MFLSAALCFGCCSQKESTDRDNLGGVQHIGGGGGGGGVDFMKVGEAEERVVLEYNSVSRLWTSQPPQPASAFVEKRVPPSVASPLRAMRGGIR